MLILQGLAENSSVTDLDLSNNGAGAEVGVVAGQGLSVNRTLSNLSLARNKLGPSGVSSLAGPLRSLSQSLSVSASLLLPALACRFRVGSDAFSPAVAQRAW